MVPICSLGQWFAITLLASLCTNTLREFRLFFNNSKCAAASVMLSFVNGYASGNSRDSQDGRKIRNAPEGFRSRMRKQKKQTIVLSSDSEDDIDSAEVAKNRGTAKTAQNAANNASIITTGKTVNTIVGPIGEWACVPENLPNHPTMVSYF